VDWAEGRLAMKGRFAESVILFGSVGKDRMGEPVTPPAFRRRESRVSHTPRAAPAAPMTRWVAAIGARASSKQRQQQCTTSHDEQDRSEVEPDLEKLPYTAEEEEHADHNPEFLEIPAVVSSGNLHDEDDGCDPDEPDAPAEVHQSRRSHPDQEQAPASGIQHPADPFGCG